MHPLLRPRVLAALVRLCNQAYQIEAQDAVRCGCMRSAA